MVKLQVQNRGRVPKLVLQGGNPRFISVHNVFISTLLHEYIKRIHESYLARSEMDTQPDLRKDEEGYSPEDGNPDDQGNVWEQLKPSTLYKKAKERGEGKYFEYLSERKEAAAMPILSLVQGISDLSGEGINIRTGRLLAATVPPPIRDGQLTLGPDQDITHEGGGIRYSFNISTPYYEEVEGGKRPIIPDDNTRDIWLGEAVEVALQQAEIEWRRVSKILNL